MEESRQQQNLHRFFQFGIYLCVLVELFLYFYAERFLVGRAPPGDMAAFFASRLATMPFFREVIHCKLTTLLLAALVSIGTRSRKKKDLDPKNHIVYPITAGLVLMFGGVLLQGNPSPAVLGGAGWYDIGYIASAIAGALLVHVAMDNVSKLFSSRLGKDRWNVEEESFMQPTEPKDLPHAVNIPMLFYYKRRVRRGYVRLENLFRGSLVCGVPGSGKSFGIFMPVIRALVGMGWTMVLYDIKFPDLGRIAYYHHLLARQRGKCPKHAFHVLNLEDVERSRRINPLKSEYIRTLADASETAEALVEALKKGDRSSGSDQFFTQSAINFLAACIYFFSRYEGGRYSSLPHVLAFLNQPYEDIFSTLFSEPELVSLLSPFRSAYNARAFEQLEGQIGTLRIFISRLATKETFWVFGGDDFRLKVSDPEHPATLVLASDPSTQGINSACYSVVLNRITKLVNSKGNLPVGIVIDEAPSLYIHRIEVLLAQARSNLVAVMLGVQELPMLKQQYGKDAADTLVSIVGNVISGAVRHKETLEWLERLFGKVRQLGESLSIDRQRTSLSLSEKLEALVPAGKIASLKAGEVVGILAGDTLPEFTGKFETSAINCRIDLDMEAIRREEAGYRPLPTYYDFNGRKTEVLTENFLRINREVKSVVDRFRPRNTGAPVPTTKGSVRYSAKK